MYIGNFEIGKQEVSIALMIIFFGTAMFFLGYKLAYDKAINYANEQIEEKASQFKETYGIIKNPDILLGNMDLPGVFENEE